MISYLEHCNILKYETCGFRLVFNSIFFTFDGKYVSNFGIPMGLCCCSEDLIIQDKEKGVLEVLSYILSFHIPFYFRYADDIVAAVPAAVIFIKPLRGSLLNKFNFFHSRLQFTIEIVNNEINFLDISID